MSPGMWQSSMVTYGGTRFLWNTGNDLPDCTLSHPRKQQPSVSGGSTSGVTELKKSNIEQAVQLLIHEMNYMYWFPIAL
jgi:hypothetical protein